MRKILLTFTFLVAVLSADTSLTSPTVQYDIRQDTKPISKPNHPATGTGTSITEAIKPNLPGSN